VSVAQNVGAVVVHGRRRSDVRSTVSLDARLRQTTTVDYERRSTATGVVTGGGLRGVVDGGLTSPQLSTFSQVSVIEIMTVVVAAFAVQTQARSYTVCSSSVCILSLISNRSLAHLCHVNK